MNTNDNDMYYALDMSACIHVQLDAPLASSISLGENRKPLLRRIYDIIPSPRGRNRITFVVEVNSNRKDDALYGAPCVSEVFEGFLTRIQCFDKRSPSHRPIGHLDPPS